MRTLVFFLALSLSNFAAAQWTKLKSGTDASLRGVSAVDAEVCWVSGSKGTVLRTSDAGSHWTKLPVPNADNLDFRDIEAINRDTAIIMSAGPAEQGQARIFKTTDAGAHWQQVFSTDRKGIFLDSMAFWDSRRGIAFSDPVDGRFVLFTTEDGGDHWKELHPRSMPPALSNEGAFAASGTAIAVSGHQDVWFGTGGASVARVFHSPDRGMHWWVSEAPIAAGKASAGIFGVAFSDAKHGIIVGGDYTKTEGSLVSIASSNDGGQTWRADPMMLPPLEGVAIAGPFGRPLGTDMRHFVAIGNAYVSPDAGGFWEVDTKISGNAISVSQKGTQGYTYVVGAKGAIYRLRSWFTRK